MNDTAMKPAPALSLARIEMVSGAPDALAEFYRAAFGFQRNGSETGASISRWAVKPSG